MAFGIAFLIVGSVSWSLAPLYFGKVIDQAQPRDLTW